MRIFSFPPFYLTDGALKQETASAGLNRQYLAATIRHVLEYTSRGKSSAAGKNDALWSIRERVHRYISHSPKSLSVLLAKPNELHLAHRNQW